jgi:hypothetical protein
MINIILNHWATYLYLVCFLGLFLVNALIWNAGFERVRSRRASNAIPIYSARRTMSRRYTAALSKCA